MQPCSPLERRFWKQDDGRFVRKSPDLFWQAVAVRGWVTTKRLLPWPPNLSRREQPDAAGACDCPTPIGLQHSFDLCRSRRSSRSRKPSFRMHCQAAVRWAESWPHWNIRQPIGICCWRSICRFFQSRCCKRWWPASSRQSRTVAVLPASSLQAYRCASFRSWMDLPQPLCGLYHRALAPGLRRRLKQGISRSWRRLQRGGTKPRAALRRFSPNTLRSRIETVGCSGLLRHAHAIPRADPSEWFLNMNTPEDWQRAQQLRFE